MLCPRRHNRTAVSLCFWTNSRLVLPSPELGNNTALFGQNKGSEWDLEPRRVSWVKTMEKLQCQGKGFGFDYPVKGSIRCFRAGLWLEQNWASGISPFGCCRSSWQGRRMLRGGKARRTGLALSRRTDLGDFSEQQPQPLVTGKGREKGTDGSLSA